MYLYFLHEVHVTISHFQIEPLSLMARIGGIIGVGQAFSGVINFIIDNIMNIKAIQFKAPHRLEFQVSNNMPQT